MASLRYSQRTEDVWGCSLHWSLRRRWELSAVTVSGKLKNSGFRWARWVRGLQGTTRSIKQPGLVYSSPECLGTGLFTGASLVLVTPVTSSLSQLPGGPPPASALRILSTERNRLTYMQSGSSLENVSECVVYHLPGVIRGWKISSLMLRPRSLMKTIGNTWLTPSLSFHMRCKRQPTRSRRELFPKPPLAHDPTRVLNGDLDILQSWTPDPSFGTHVMSVIQHLYASFPSPSVEFSL